MSEPARFRKQRLSNSNSTGRLPDVRSNENLATTLRNLEAVMVVFFSAAFFGAFSEILGYIEGFARPLELVSADFLKHPVETELSKIFRVTRSQTSNYDVTMLMSTPQLCAANSTNFVNALVKDLSNDVERARSEEFCLQYSTYELKNPAANRCQGIMHNRVAIWLLPLRSRFHQLQRI